MLYSQVFSTENSVCPYRPRFTRAVISFFDSLTAVMAPARLGQIALLPTGLKLLDAAASRRSGLSPACCREVLCREGLIPGSLGGLYLEGLTALLQEARTILIPLTYELDELNLRLLGLTCPGLEALAARLFAAPGLVLSVHAFPAPARAA